jgi:hypothetical protein
MCSSEAWLTIGKVRGEQAWSSIEHDLAIRVECGSGHVALLFILREKSAIPAWTASVTVHVEVGEEMALVASAVEQLLP